MSIMEEHLITIKRKNGETVSLTPREVSEALESLLLYIATTSIESVCKVQGYKIPDHDKEILANKAEYGAYISILADVRKRVELLLQTYDDRHND